MTRRLGVTQRCARRAVVLLLLSSAKANPEEFEWPLDINVALSSTFGESRSSSFHAGVDLKTWGKTGYEVRSIGEGHVWRLRTSPWGYGRAVYVKLADGQIVVYAHLEAFAPKLARPVKREQTKTDSYSVDVWFKEDEMPVEAGELIAWTGESGIGPPHLHLELRDANNLPVNPMLHGFKNADSVAPTLRRIALIPFGIESNVEGGHRPLNVGLARNHETGRHETADVLTVYGRIGVAILGYDRADGADNKLAPYRYTHFVDGEGVFSASYGRFSYADGHHIFLDRTRLEIPGGSGRFSNLFRLPGNRLEFYESIDGSDGILACGLREGGIVLDKGLHELLVQSQDVAGNRSQAVLSIYVNAPPSIGPLQLLRDGKELWVNAKVADADNDRVRVDVARSVRGDEWDVVEQKRVKAPSEVTFKMPAKGPGLWRMRVRDGDGGEVFRTAAARSTAAEVVDSLDMTLKRTVYSDFVHLELSFNQLLVAHPRLRVEEEGRISTLVPRQTGSKTYEASLPLRSEGANIVRMSIHAQGIGEARVAETVTFSQQQVAPSKDAIVHLDEGRVTLVIPSGSAFEPFFPQVDLLPVEETTRLAGTKTAYEFGPEGTTFDRNIAVNLRYSELLEVPVERLGVYTGGNGSWAFVGNELNQEQRTISAWVRRFSRYAVMADTTLPVVSKVRPKSGSVLKERKPSISAQVRDEGSGIGRESDIALELDGLRLISEYDPESGSVRYQVEEALAQGKHTVTVTVVDRSGNEAVVQSEFTVR